MEIRIRGRTYLFDDEDKDKLDKISNFYIDKDGYLLGYLDKKVIRVHRYIMNTPKNLVVDHINRNILDNRKQNLRNVERYINSNNTKPRKSNTTGVKGVYYFKRDDAYISSFTFRGKVYRKQFKKLEDAIAFRKNIEIRL